jgi:hypothetical protein
MYGMYVCMYVRKFSTNLEARYELDGPGIESQWGWNIPCPSWPALDFTQPFVQWTPSLFPRGKALGRGAGHPPRSSAEVENELELHPRQPSVPA